MGRKSKHPSRSSGLLEPTVSQTPGARAFARRFGSSERIARIHPCSERLGSSARPGYHKGCPGVLVDMGLGAQARKKAAASPAKRSRKARQSPAGNTPRTAAALSIAFVVSRGGPCRRGERWAHGEPGKPEEHEYILTYMLEYELVLTFRDGAPADPATEAGAASGSRFFACRGIGDRRDGL
jgi:hypothetical protein